MTNEQLKKEAIKKAYGEYWDRIKDEMTEDFYAPYRLLKNSKGITFDFKTMHIIYGSPEPFVRPIILRGIETNKNWIRIEEDGSNLPKESGDYWFYTKHKQVLIRDYNPGFNLYESYLNTYTHYQAIVKPLPPIY
jgi:hypothetical protein